MSLLSTHISSQAYLLFSAVHLTIKRMDLSFLSHCSEVAFCDVFAVDMTQESSNLKDELPASLMWSYVLVEESSVMFSCHKTAAATCDTHT